MFPEARSRYTGTITNVSLTRYRGQSQKKLMARAAQVREGRKNT